MHGVPGTQTTSFGVSGQACLRGLSAWGQPQRLKVMRALAWFGVVASLLIAVPALAQSSADKAGARAAANAGADAYDAGKFEKSLDLFTRAESIIHSPIHELYIARSLIQLNRLVEARELLLKIRRAGESDRATAGAEEELQRLEPRLSRLNLHLEGTDAAPTSVQIDGREVNLALLGIAQPIDPGDHRVKVLYKGTEKELGFTVTEGETKEVVVDLSGVVGESQVGPVSPPAEEQAPEATPTEDVQPADSAARGQPIGAYVALGVGVVGIGVGTGFALSAGASAKNANQLCEEIDERTGASNCSGRTAEEQSDVENFENKHKSSKTVSIVGFAVGGAAIATGATLLWLHLRGAKKEQARSQVHIEPILGVQYWGLKGSF